MYRVRLSLGMIAALLVATAIGCGKTGPKMYRVSGKVTYTAGAAPHAGVNLVSFVPTKDSKAEVRRNATGPIAADGTFEMFTRMNGDGVNAGDYSVLFDIAKTPTDSTSMIPPKYTDMGSPPYKITVDRDYDNLEYTIDMSAGGAGK